jgi:hypothetical protein
MHTIRPTRIIIVPLFLLMTGCALFQSVAQQIEKNPIVAAQSFEEAVATANDVAVALFDAAAPFLPASVQAKAEADFASDEATLQHSLVALNAGIAAAEAGQAGDLSALIADVQTAVTAIVAIVQQYAGTLSAPASHALGAARAQQLYADLIAAKNVVLSYH